MREKEVVSDIYIVVASKNINVNPPYIGGRFFEFTPCYSIYKDKEMKTIYKILIKIADRLYRTAGVK